MPRTLITGANTGIGLGLVKSLLQAGHEVIACVRKPEYFGFLNEELRPLMGGKGLLHLRAFELSGDFTKALEEIAATLGVPDVLINNAGIFIEDGSSFEERRAAIEKTMAINVFSIMRICDFFGPLMKGLPSGRILNISSLMGSLSDNHSGGYLSYRMSKAALNMFTVNLAREMDNTRVRVFALHPGWIKTRMGGQNAPDDVSVAVNRILYALSEEADRRHGEFLVGNQSLPW
jgi:NAD(P)-dependent dehydrogenase (short-subunit alcohol dehydrogenase family)